jgi:hypothetical protein
MFAWQAWWIDESGVTRFLGDSGNISKNYETQQMRFKTNILQLPKNVNSGTLVVYLSAQLYKRAGMARLMCASLSWLIKHCSVTWPVESR